MMSMPKNYTSDQLKDAEKLAQILGNVRSDKQGFIATMANAFIAGVETGMQMADKKSRLGL